MLLDAQEFTLYFVGDSAEEAVERLPFDSFESANDYVLDEGGTVFMATAYLDKTSVREAV